jgi:hypothetical protein
MITGNGMPDTSYLDPGALVGGSVNDPDPIARAGALQRLEALPGQSQPVPGIAHGSIPGLLGVALNGGAGPSAGAPGLPGALWRPTPGASIPTQAPPMPAFPPVPFMGPAGQPSPQGARRRRLDQRHLRCRKPLQWPRSLAPTPWGWRPRNRCLWGQCRDNRVGCHRKPARLPACRLKVATPCCRPARCSIA